MIDQTIINNLKQICSDFLFEHGGMKNGYETYISGSTLKSEGLSVRINNNDLTINELSNLSKQLHSLILKYLLEINLDVIIRFIPVHIEFGVFETKLEIVYPIGRLF